MIDNGIRGTGEETRGGGGEGESRGGGVKMIRRRGETPALSLLLRGKGRTSRGEGCEV